MELFWDCKTTLNAPDTTNNIRSRQIAHNATGARSYFHFLLSYTYIYNFLVKIMLHHDNQKHNYGLPEFLGRKCESKG